MLHRTVAGTEHPASPRPGRRAGHGRAVGPYIACMSSLGDMADDMSARQRAAAASEEDRQRQLRETRRENARILSSMLDRYAGEFAFECRKRAIGPEWSSGWLRRVRGWAGLEVLYAYRAPAHLHHDDPQSYEDTVVVRVCSDGAWAFEGPAPEQLEHTPEEELVMRSFARRLAELME